MLARFEDLRSLAFGSISGTYALVGTATNNPVRLIDIDNTTDANLIISFNGIDDKIFVAANGFKIYDFASNKSNQGGSLDLPAFTLFYVKQESSAPTTGNVYIGICYASAV